jgi:hypothetical protein
MYPILVRDTRIDTGRKWQSFLFRFLRRHGRKDSWRQAHDRRIVAHEHIFKSNMKVSDLIIKNVKQKRVENTSYEGGLSWENRNMRHCTKAASWHSSLTGMDITWWYIYVLITLINHVIILYATVKFWLFETVFISDGSSCTSVDCCQWCRKTASSTVKEEDGGDSTLLWIIGNHAWFQASAAM